MSKKSRLMSIVLVLAMLVPMFSAFTLGATAVTYAEAQDGDLLHSFDKDTSFVAGSTGYIDGKNGGTFTWNADGTGATLKQTVKSSSLKWGGTLVDSLPLTDDAKYTFVFDLTLSHAHMVFGVLVDGGAGFAIRGNGMTYWLSDYANYKADTGDWNGYEGCSSTGKQTFAVEFDVAARKYTIYTLKSDNTWHNGGSIAYSSWSYDHDYMTLGFFAMAINGTGTGKFNTLSSGYDSRTAAFSDLKIYKGVGLTSKFTDALNAAAEEEARIAAEKLQAAKDNYALLTDGEIAYTANFNGTTDVWAPSTEAASQAATEASGAGAKNPFESTTINSENKITFSISGSNKARAWGADVQNLPYGNGFNYTVKFKYERTANIPLAFYIDSVQGFYIYTDKVYPRHNNTNDSSSPTNLSGIPGNTPSATSPSVQEFAIQIDGTNETFTLFAKNDQQRWTEILTWNDENSDGVFYRDYLGLYFYANDASPSGSIAVSDLVVYKGISTLAAENKALDERPFDDYADGDLVKTVDFNESGDWAPALIDDGEGDFDNYDDITATVSADGTAVTFTAGADNNKRGIWGDEFVPTFPLTSGTQMTFFYHLSLSANGSYFGFYPDGQNGLTVRGDGNVALFHRGSRGDYVSWADATDVTGKEQDFALQLDYTAGTMELFVRNCNGLYVSALKSEVPFKEGVTTLQGAFYAAGKNAGETVTVSNFEIYKGLVVDVLDPAAIGLDVYEAAADGDELQVIDFKAEGWNPDYADVNNADANYEPSADGSAITITVLNRGNKRAIWGDKLVDTLPLARGVKYTFLYDVTFGNANVGFAFYVDSENGLVVYGNGNSEWRSWNSEKVKNDTKWTDKTDVDGMTQTFALEMDYDAKSFSLYVKQSNGSFALVTTKSSSFIEVAELYLTLNSRCSGTPDDSYTVDLSNVTIYKGTGLAGGGFFTSFDDLNDGDLVKEVTFNEFGNFVPAISAEETFNDLSVAVSNSNKTVTFTVLDADNLCGIWGAPFVPALPLSNGSEYTFFFDLKLSDEGSALAFLPDGTNGILIKGDGTAVLYNGANSASWADVADIDGKAQRFAIQLDYDAGTMELFVQIMNGDYVSVFTANATFVSGDLNCTFFAAGTEAGQTAAVSNMEIYKGFIVDVFDPDACGVPAYEAAEDGDVLRTVDFDAEGWNPDYADDDNLGADVEVAPDGSSVKMTVHNGDNFRAMWGASLVDVLPLTGGVQYTFLFDLTFGNEGVGFSIYPDNNNGLLINGDGSIKWYNWNSSKVNSDANWIACTDVPADETQTFAITMDYSAKTYGLYVKLSNGAFAYVGSVKYNSAWSGYDTFNCRLYIRSNTKDESGKKYVADATYTAEIANLQIIKGISYAERRLLQNQIGASIRLEDPTGLRFSGNIGKDLLDGLKADYGEENVKIGMVITPTQFLKNNDLDFTMEALDGCVAINGVKYLKIEGNTILHTDDPDSNVYSINCCIANVKEANYAVNFSAVMYVEINGTTHLYANYNADENSRSVADVASRALADVSETQDGEYQYEIVVEDATMYSPYTSAQQEILAGFAAALNV